MIHFDDDTIEEILREAPAIAIGFIANLLSDGKYDQYQNFMVKGSSSKKPKAPPPPPTPPRPAEPPKLADASQARDTQRKDRRRGHRGNVKHDDDLLGGNSGLR